jgi:transposase
MANKTISMTKIKQFIRLKQSGYSQRKIADMLVIHRDTIRKYEQHLEVLGCNYEELLSQEDELLEGLFDKPEHKPADKQRFDLLYSFFPYADKELARVGVDRQNLWQEYIERYPDGYTYAHFCRGYKQWKKAQQVSAHFEHKAGDKLFIDFTGKKLGIVDKKTGEIKRVEVLVAVLGYSHYTYVEATLSQKKGDFISAIENALHYCGGVPQALVTDNLKSAVAKGCKYEPQLNETFEGFANHYRTTILPTRVYKPKDKAIVEGAVNIIYKRVFAPLRDRVFFNLTELNQAIWELLDKHNEKGFKERGHSRKILFEQIEKPSLAPLPGDKYELNTYGWHIVHKNGHVYLYEDKHYYSVPYTYIGKRLKVVYNNTQVEIYYHHQRIAAHQRDRRDFAYTTVPAHMASAHRFVSEWSPEKFISWASDIGGPTKAMVEKIIETKSHPEQAYKACLGVLHMGKKVGKERLNKACARAMYYESYGYRVVKKILAQGLEQEPVQLEIPIPIPKHDNLRGQQYYQ